MQRKDDKPAPFTGFKPEALEFLINVKENNSKAWFEEHRQDYDEYILQPMQNLVVELADFIKSVDPLCETIPAVNKTISRIYRDTRFSKDKSLYRDSAWITFKRRRDDWQDTPVYFFEITPAGYRYGMGYYNATKESMDKFRQMMDTTPEEFLEAISFFTNGSTYTLEGEKYKRLLSPNQPAEIQDWYQRKSFFLSCNREIEDNLFSPELVNDIISAFKETIPLYRFLWRIKD